MGKNKNRNKKNDPKILSSNPGNSSSKPCNTFQGIVNRTGFREDIQNEWEDFFNESSKTNTFKKPDSQKTSLVSAKDKAKRKIDPIAGNEIKRSLGNVCTQSVSRSPGKDVAESNYFNRKINEEPSIGCPQRPSYVAPAVNKARSKEKDQTYSNKFMPNGVLNAKNNFSCKITQNTSIEKNAVPNHSSLGCLNTSTSNGTRPKTNIVTNQSKNSLNSQIVSKESSESLYESIKNCKAESDNFCLSYITWEKERQETIAKLKKLARDVHRDQHLFNKTNAFFKELNICSREVKLVEISTPVNFLSSLATLVTDAASGVTSVAQAFSIDAYMDTFAKIMEHDKEITIPLYAVRSLCLKQYQNVEEVLRKYHSDTFGNTVANISSSLEELWLDIKDVQGAGKTSNVVDTLDQYFRISLNNEALGKVYDSIQKYNEKNPAALNACASAGKVWYDVWDFWNGNIKGTPSNIISRVINTELLMIEKIQLNELCHNEYEMQARLESDIYDAIQGLQEEMEQIANNFKEICYPFKERIYD